MRKNKEMNKNQLSFLVCERASGDVNTKRKVTWDYSNQLNVDDYLEQCNLKFEKAGWVEKSSNVCGYSIKTTTEWVKRPRVLYLLVVDGKIFKGGKSKNSLPNRSYSAGTDKNWVNGANGCSPTNYAFSKIFLKCLEEGKKVDFYIHGCPMREELTKHADGTETIEITSQYEAMETNLNKHLRTVLGKKLIGDGKLFEEYKS
jgi:hypothetical protein